MTPHDALFRALMAHPEDAAGVLRAIVPAGARDRIDWTTLEAVPGSFVAPELQTLHVDALFRASLGDSFVLLYLLLEHQSESDPRMPFRMLQYMTAVLARHVKEHPEESGLPLVIPLVLHHGARGWTAPRSLREMWNAEEAVLAALGPHLLDLTLAIDDLARVPEAELVQRNATDIAIVLWLLLQTMRQARDPITVLERCLPHLERMLRVPRGWSALDAVWMYSFLVGESEPAELRKLAKRLGEKAEEAAMTGAEKLRQEGEARGLSKGRAEALLRQLSRKFGPVAPEVEARVRGAGLADLDRWTDEVLTAKTLAEMGL